MENYIYNILTIVIVAFAFYLFGRKLYQSFKKSDTVSCDCGCDGCATKCDLKNLVQKQKAG